MSKIIYKKYSIESKSLSTLLLVIFWLFLGFLIMFVGINNTYALDYNNIGYIDNYSDVLIDVTYETENNSLLTVEKTQEVYTEIKILYINVSNYNFNANTHYQLELSLPNMTLNNANYYEVYDSNNNNCTISNEFSTFNTAYPKWDFECKNNTNAITIKVGNRNNTAITDTGTFRWNYTYLRYTNTPIENINQQIGEDIINNQNQNTQDIINNNNQNTQDIIDSNKETQDVIKDQFNTCRDSLNLIDYSMINTYTIQSNGYYFILFPANKQILNGKFEENTQYTLSFYGYRNSIQSGGAGGFDFVYTDGTRSTVRVDTTNPTFKVLTSQPNKTISYILATWGSTQNTYIKDLMLSKGNTSINYEPYGEEICSNKIDETNDKLNDLNSSLNDSNVDGSLGNAGSFFDNFTTSDHGGLSGIITAPLVAINQMLNTSCNPMTTTFKGKELSLPCGYEFWNKMGPIQDFVNLVLGGLLCYQIIIKLYKLIEKIKNPEDDRLEVMDL